jgi:hypothetical protein
MTALRTVRILGCKPVRSLTLRRARVLLLP